MLEIYHRIGLRGDKLCDNIVTSSRVARHWRLMDTHEEGAKLTRFCTQKAQGSSIARRNSRTHPF